TRDFMPLARMEKVRSALAVPILSRDAIIGVLEVWRRRPVSFDAEDTPLLLALAGLASIAIDNALLLRAHAETAERLTVAYGEL
ncbi:GAF domain-containing protein, partial [Acinetobacter baumannii]